MQVHENTPTNTNFLQTELHQSQLTRTSLEQPLSSLVFLTHLELNWNQ